MDNNTTDDEDLGEGTPFSKTKDEQLAGMIMEMVGEDDRGVAFHIVDKFIIQLRKLRAKIEVLEEVRPRPRSRAIAGPRDL